MMWDRGMETWVLDVWPALLMERCSLEHSLADVNLVILWLTWFYCFRYIFLYIKKTLGFSSLFIIDLIWASLKRQKTWRKIRLFLWEMPLIIVKDWLCTLCFLWAHESLCRAAQSSGLYRWLLAPVISEVRIKVFAKISVLCGWYLIDWSFLFRNGEVSTSVQSASD